MSSKTADNNSLKADLETLMTKTPAKTKARVAKKKTVNLVVEKNQLFIRENHTLIVDDGNALVFTGWFLFEKEQEEANGDTVKLSLYRTISDNYVCEKHTKYNPSKGGGSHKQALVVKTVEQLENFCLPGRAGMMLMLKLPAALGVKLTTNIP